SQQSLYRILYLNLLIALSIVLKVIPLPLGMSLAFVVPILTAALIHPYWGALVGFFSVLISAFVTGGIGPWTPIQMYLFVLIPALLIWVPVQMKTNKLFLMGYGILWGMLYGFLIGLYFWPMMSQPLSKEAQMDSFLLFYVSTSLLWDLFRAGGNALFLFLLYTPFKQAISHIESDIMTQWQR
ncbi:MAG: ECF transporter S component, partial [Deltaproteobacteria bacterium]|nr:ECF transporter S component [Deltaproteobacteria bacterium]